MSALRHVLVPLGGLVLAGALIAIGILAASSGGRGEAANEWSTPEPIPGAIGAPGTAVTFDGEGGLHLAWASEERGRWRLDYRHRAPDSTWSSPETVVSDRPLQITQVDLAANRSGGAAVVWEYASRQRSVLQASLRGSSGWEPEQTIAPVQNGTFSPRVELDERGGVSVAWTSLGRGGVWGLRRPAGAPWSDPVRLVASANASSERIDIAVSEEGRTLVLASAGERRAEPGRLVAVSGTPDGRWSAPKTVDDHSPGAHVALSLTGDRAIAAWVRAPDGRPRRGELVAARGSLDGRFGDPVVLDKGRDDTFGEVVAARADERPVIAWSRWQPRWTGEAIRAATIGSGDIAPATLAEYAVPDRRGGREVAVGSPYTGLKAASSGNTVGLVWSQSGGTLEAPESRVKSAGLRGERWDPVRAVPGASAFRSPRALSAGPSEVQAVLSVTSLRGGGHMELARMAP